MNDHDWDNAHKCKRCGMMRTPAGKWLGKPAYWYRMSPDHDWTRKRLPCKRSDGATSKQTHED